MTGAVQVRFKLKATSPLPNPACCFSTRFTPNNPGSDHSSVDSRSGRPCMSFEFRPFAITVRFARAVQIKPPKTKQNTTGASMGNQALCRRNYCCCLKNLYSKVYQWYIMMYPWKNNTVLLSVFNINSFPTRIPTPPRQSQ